MSTSPSRPFSDGLTMGASSTSDRLMNSMDTQRGGASSSTRLQPRLASSSLVLTPLLDSAKDVRVLFADILTGLEELRHDMAKINDRKDERSQQGHEKLRTLVYRYDHVLVFWLWPGLFQVYMWQHLIILNWHKWKWMIHLGANF